MSLDAEDLKFLVGQSSRRGPLMEDPASASWVEDLEGHRCIEDALSEHGEPLAELGGSEQALGVSLRFG